VSSSEVRKAQPADVERLGEVLARAFHEDPLFCAVVPDEARRRRGLPVLFRELTRLLHLPIDSAWTTEDLAGAALWAPPGRWKVGLWTEAKMAPKVLGALGARVVAMLRVLAEVEARHPTDRPHHYLRVLGCDPGRQGRGVGSRLLQPMLDELDRTKTAAYLESSNERNLPFYRRHGFEPLEELRTRLGPRVWLMWRNPR
jgi:ribosomal protein S18 acetylase RimI-like enzyme